MSSGVTTKVVAGAAGVAAAVLGVAAATLARTRRVGRVNAELWRDATQGVAERDLTPPSTVAVDSSRRPPAGS